MLTRCAFLRVGISALAVALSACGGGGGGGVASAPPPPPTPTPTPASYTVNIFPDPKPETYATVGLGPDSSLPHIRYSSGGYYELQVPGKTWEQLKIPSNVVPQDPATFNYFTTADGDAVSISLARLSGYRYSEFDGYTLAFGSATPPGGVPVTGAATYTGIAHGTTDLTQKDFLAGTMPIPVAGTVNLNFNFGAGTLGGSMTLHTATNFGGVDLGTFAFKNTVYSPGSLTYSGAFVTPATGDNQFLGRFTGPNAEETIGAWALPFMYSPDGQNHQAYGAWIAKAP